MTTKYQDNIRALLDLNAPIPKQTPVPPRPPRPVYHSDECGCDSCCSIRDSMDRYIAAKRLYELNGF